MKIEMSFADFSAGVSSVGRAFEQSKAIFYVKCPKGGKVELNLHSGTFTVGSGCKLRDVITAAVEKSGFKIAKRAKGWTVVSADGYDQGDLLAHFCALYKVVEGAVASSSAKATKAKAVAKGKLELSDMLNSALGGKTKSTKSVSRKAA